MPCGFPFFDVMYFLFFLLLLCPTVLIKERSLKSIPSCISLKQAMTIAFLLLLPFFCVDSFERSRYQDCFSPSKQMGFLKRNQVLDRSDLIKFSKILIVYLPCPKSIHSPQTDSN